MNITRSANSDRSFKMKLNKNQQSTTKVKLNKIDRSIDVTGINTSDKEASYDEIIYYDGGGVHGYGN